MHPDNMNRRHLSSSPIFEMRGNEVKWPTLRGAYLTDNTVEVLRKHMVGRGRSIIFLDGTYRTNLNQWADRSPIERAVFFEYLVKHPNPSVKGGIFALCWIGDFHNGSIFHCAWQYPQIRCWLEASDAAEWFFERRAFRIYNEVAQIMYGTEGVAVDPEVQEFLDHGKGASK